MGDGWDNRRVPQPVPAWVHRLRRDGTHVGRLCDPRGRLLDRSRCLHSGLIHLDRIGPGRGQQEGQRVVVNRTRNHPKQNPVRHR